MLLPVKDANDHAPTWEASKYGVVLAEAAPVGSFVAAVAATDGDAGENAKIRSGAVDGKILRTYALGSECQSGVSEGSKQMSGRCERKTE